MFDNSSIFVQFTDSVTDVKMDVCVLLLLSMLVRFCNNLMLAIGEVNVLVVTFPFLERQKQGINHLNLGTVFRFQCCAAVMAAELKTYR